MKLLTRFYYLPFIIGIIISIVLWLGQLDVKLRAEGFAKLNINHSLSDRVSHIYWKNCTTKILEKFNNEKVMVMEKRGSFRFYSANNDIEEIRKNYQIVKNEVKKYKEIYVDYIRSRVENELEKKKFSLKLKKMIKSSEEFLPHLSKQEFLGDLKTNEIIFRNHQFVYITLLISFLLSIILFNIKKVF